MAKTFSDLRKTFPSTDYYLMFCYLLGKQNEDGEIHITKKEMEQETGYSWRQVKRFLDWFEQQRGIVSVLKSGCNGGCNYYIENEYLSTLCGSKTYSIVVVIQKEEKPINPANIIPPKIEDVAAYIKEKGYDIDVEVWYNFYQAKDWKIGINKMKNWQSCLRTWTKNNRTPFAQTEQPKVKYDPYKEQYEKFIPWCKTSMPDYSEVITFDMFKAMLKDVPKEKFFIILKRMYESGFRGSDLLKEFREYI